MHVCYNVICVVPTNSLHVMFTKLATQLYSITVCPYAHKIYNIAYFTCIVLLNYCIFYEFLDLLLKKSYNICINIYWKSLGNYFSPAF